MSYTTQAIRNIAFVGHTGVGKTSLFEALLHVGGTTQTAGSIERGNTVSDYDPMEKHYEHSLNTAIASIDRDGCHINLIDTPGYADFCGPTLSAIAAVETCAIVVNAHNGIELNTRRMMEYAKARGVCRLLIVNKIDGGNCRALIEQLRETFGPECLPINLPASGGKTVVDCFFKPSGVADFGSVAEAHQRIVDQVVEINETVMDHYLEAGEQALSGSELHDAFEQCLREGHLVPICFVSARTGAGVRELLDLMVKLLPNPAEGNPPQFLKGVGADAEPVVAVPDASQHVIADVFKTINDPFVGKLSVFRVYQGTIKKDAQLFVDDGKKPFKVTHLYKLRGRDHIEIAQAIAGDIAAVAKIDEVHFDAVLHDSHDEDNFHLKPLDFPQRTFSLAIKTAARGQEQKLAIALSKLTEEDPCFTVEHRDGSNETVIHGLGDLHLRVMIARLHERYGVEVTSHAPKE